MHPFALACYSIIGKQRNPVEHFSIGMLQRHKGAFMAVFAVQFEQQ
jgi:hypothetical protein